jgi:hypothetical protein
MSIENKSPINFAPDEPIGGPEPGSQPDQAPAQTPETAEFQLTPEIEEMIMDKIQDINKYGTAFCSIDFFQDSLPSDRLAALKNILSVGLLGKNDFEKSTTDINFKVEKWKKFARNWDVSNNRIWFNIVGRIKDVPDPDFQIGSSMGHKGVAAIFNLKDMRELDYGYLSNIDMPGRPSEKIRHTFSSHETRVYGGNSYSFEKFMQKLFPGRENKIPPHRPGSVYGHRGFVTPFRVSPQLFNGIVLNSVDQKFIDDAINSDITVNEKMPNRLLPIYDGDCNLLWPRQMSYEEVKAFVAERDAKKAQESAEAGAPESAEEEKQSSI